MEHGYIIGNLSLLLRFLNKTKNQIKKIKLEIEKKIDSLLKITFDFITRQCKRSYDEKADQVLDIKWHKTSLFCLGFKIKSKIIYRLFLLVDVYIRIL